MDDKCKDRELALLNKELDHLRNQCAKLVAEKDRLDQALVGLSQQISGLPAHVGGLQVRIPPPKGGPGWEANYFLLRPDQDPAAVAALRAYAQATDNEWIRFDILDWLGEAKEEDRPEVVSVIDLIAQTLEDMNAAKQDQTA